MNEFDPDTELQDLLRQERAKEPFLLESIEPERRQLLEALYDHAMAVYESRDEEISVEAILEADSSTDDSEVTRQLDQLIQYDIARFETIIDGEMQVSGEGAYLQVVEAEDDKDIDSLIQFLGDGDVVRGDIVKYTVQPIFPYEEFQKAKNNNYSEAPAQGYRDDPAGLSVVLENAALYDTSGNEVATLGWVLAPMVYPSLVFDRVLRQFSGNTETGAVPESEIDVSDILAGGLFQEHCNDIENDLNRNEYSADEFKAQYDLQMEALARYVAAVDTERVLSLSATGTNTLSGASVELNDSAVNYDAPTIIRHNDDWRVVHGFSLVTDDMDDAMMPVHVLPENIQTVRLP